MNDFIKNKQKQNSLQSKPARKRWSFYVACFIMLFWTVGAILGGISFSQNCVQVNADVITSYSYNGNLLTYSDSTGNTPDNDFNCFTFKPMFDFLPNGSNIKFNYVYRSTGFYYSLIRVFKFRYDSATTNVLGDGDALTYNFLTTSDYFYIGKNKTIIDDPIDPFGHYIIFNSDERFDFDSFINYVYEYGSEYYLSVRHHTFLSDDTFNCGLHLKFNTFTNDISYVVFSHTGSVNENRFVPKITYYDSLGNELFYIEFLFGQTLSFYYETMGSPTISPNTLLGMNITGSYYIAPLTDTSADSYYYNSGYSSGYNVGYDDGRRLGYTSGYKDGNNAGYNSGYAVGFSSAVAEDTYSFNSLFGAVIDAPIKAFRGLFSFEVFGVDMTNFLLSLFTVCVIITIIKVAL